VTFLFTDIEGSTGLWETAPDATDSALAWHDSILRDAIGAHGGYVFATGGDGFAAAFARAADALAAAEKARTELANEHWPEGATVRVRMALHTGEASERDGNYFGSAVNRAARLMAVGHGGQLLVSAVTAELLTDVELVDLGEHRLRDLAAPMRVFQVGPGSFPPLRSMDFLPGNLPQVVSALVGRVAELTAIAEAVRANRLVTLTGVGGVGKTRLALQVAADAMTGFSDGAWLCELAAASTGDELAHVVAVALGVGQRPHMSLAASIVDFLRPRQELVLLDNCEHLHDDAADLAEAIMAGAPRVHVLATSREGLGVRGEQMWPLRSLDLAPRQTGPSEAVELFASRAQAVDPAFALDDKSLAAVAEVCRRLDGIPLAIELAAARVATMSPGEIAGHLDERFRLLTGARRRGVERHQTLRSAIAWSYSLLTDTERVVFDRLGVFPSSFDEAAAVAVACGDGVERWDVIDAVAALVAKSMVGAERSEEPTRYQLLETLRHFAREQLEARGETDTTHRRHAAHYARVAEEVGGGLMSPDALHWRPRLIAELDNLRAATGWAFDGSVLDDSRLGVRVLEPLMSYSAFSPLLGIQAFAATALPELDELAAEERAVVLSAGAMNSYWRGDIGLVRELAGRAVAEASTFAPAVAVAYTYLGLAIAATGDADGAMAVLVEGRARLAASGLTSHGSGRVIESGLGWLAYNAGDLELARSVAAEYLEAAQRAGVPGLIAGALALVARTLPDDRADDALEAAQESMRLIDAGAGCEALYGPAAQTVAMLLSSRNDPTGAARALHRGVSYSADLGELMTNASNVAFAVFVLADAGDLVGAATLGGATAGEVLSGQVLSPDHRQRYDAALSQVAQCLGPGYGDASRRGAAMSYDEIIHFTLSHLALVSGSA
jgi:predicted ATPase